MEMAKTFNDMCGAVTSKRLLGQVLVEGGFITTEQLERALQEQARTGEKLGEVLVRQGLVEPVEVRAAVAVQGRIGTYEEAIRAAAGVRRQMGELLLQARWITPDALDRALTEQRLTGERLGEVLLRQELLTPQERDAVLEFQRRQADDTEASTPLRLGEILVATGEITRSQLDAVLDLKRTSGRRVGELLVDAGFAHPQQVARGLRLQEKLVTAALVAVLSMAGVAGAGDLDPAGSRAASAGAKITVSATVAPRATLKVVHQRPELVITGADIARGYVDVPSASRIEVRNNSPAGYLLVFEDRDGFLQAFDQVQVRGLGTEVQIGRSGGWIPQPYSRGTETMELSYRFILMKHARPGTYAWPLTVTTRPL